MWDPSARHLGEWLLLLFPMLVFAQDAGIDRHAGIGLPEALVRTLAGNPELIAFGYQLQAAEARVQQAGLAPNPKLEVTLQDALGTGDFSGLASTETTVTLGWILERRTRQRLVEVAKADLSLRSMDAEIMRLDAAAETARRFLDCLAYQGRLRNAVEAIRLAQETVEAVRTQTAAGRTLQAELARAEAELARAELLEKDYEHELLSAYHRLSAQWGDTQPDFGSVSGTLQMFPKLVPLETLLSRAEQNHEFARLVSRQRLAEAGLRLAKARSRPSWYAYGGLRRFEATDDFALVGGITVPLPIRDRNEGRIAEARADMARTEAETGAARVRIETALFVLYQKLRHNLQLAERLTNDVIPRIQRALADSRRAYDLGRYSYFEWSVVQMELLEAHSELLEANIDAHRITIEIERLTGVRATLPSTVQ